MNKTIKINDWIKIPKNFTGVAEHLISGINYWFKEGNLHRDNGPAIEYINGNKEWWVEGLRHRIRYRDWETDRKSTRLNSSHSGETRMPSSA